MFSTHDVHVDSEDTTIEVSSSGTAVLIHDSRDTLGLPGGIRLFFGGNPREIQYNSQLLIDALRRLQSGQDDS